MELVGSTTQLSLAVQAATVNRLYSSFVCLPMCVHQPVWIELPVSERAGGRGLPSSTSCWLGRLTSLPAHLVCVPSLQFLYCESIFLCEPFVRTRALTPPRLPHRRKRGLAHRPFGEERILGQKATTKEVSAVWRREKYSSLSTFLNISQTQKSNRPAFSFLREGSSEPDLILRLFRRSVEGEKQ